MLPNTVFTKSAFKHNITEENICWALMNNVADGLIEEGDETKYLAIGFDKNGNLLEIMYNHVGVDTVKVFHAISNLAQGQVCCSYKEIAFGFNTSIKPSARMKCRKQYYEQYDELRRKYDRYDR